MFHGEQAEWPSFYFTFPQLSNDMKWSNPQRKQHLLQRLCGKAASYILSKPHATRYSFRRLMKELRKRFDAKEPPSAMRHQLLDARQELGESLVEFAECILHLVQRALPGISSQALAPFAVDCFLRGCQEKAAAVLAMERQLQTVPKALQVLKHILDSHQAIYGPKSVSFRQLKQVAEPRLRTPPRPDAEECATEEDVQQLALKVEVMLTSHVDPSRSLERSSRLGTGSLGTCFQRSDR